MMLFSVSVCTGAWQGPNHHVYAACAQKTVGLCMVCQSRNSRQPTQLAAQAGMHAERRGV